MITRIMLLGLGALLLLGALSSAATSKFYKNTNYTLSTIEKSAVVEDFVQAENARKFFIGDNPYNPPAEAVVIGGTHYTKSIYHEEWSLTHAPPSVDHNPSSRSHLFPSHEHWSDSEAHFYGSSWAWGINEYGRIWVLFE